MATTLCRLVIASVVALGSGSVTAAAQEPPAPPDPSVVPLLASAADQIDAVSALLEKAEEPGAVPDATPETDRSTSPVLLAALDALTVTSHALDVHSTLSSLDRGAVEANPLLRGVSKHPAALIGVKAALGVSLIYVTRKIAKSNQVVATLASVAVNSVLLTAAHHNYSTARTLQAR